MKNVVSKKVIHHGKKLDKTKQHEEKVPNPSKNGQPVLDETSEKKYKKVLFENDSDKGANYNRMPEENQQQISSRQANHHITPINRTPEQIQGKRRSSGVDYSESVDETASSNDFYPEVKKNVRAIPTPGAFFGSSPTVGQTMVWSFFFLCLEFPESRNWEKFTFSSLPPNTILDLSKVKVFAGSMFYSYTHEAHVKKLVQGRLETVRGGVKSFPNDKF